MNTSKEILFESGSLKLFKEGRKHFITLDTGKFVSNQFETIEITQAEADDAMNYLSEWLNKLIIKYIHGNKYGSD